MKRWDVIKAILKNKKYLAIAIIAALIYLGLYMWQITATSGSFFTYVKTFVAWYVYTSVPLTFGIAGLTGITVALFAARLKEFRAFKAASAGSMGGVFAGILGAGCPGCAVGLFPLIASAFGISATLGSLPLGGIELQLFSVGVLGVSIFLLSKPVVSEVKPK